MKKLSRLFKTILPVLFLALSLNGFSQQKHPSSGNKFPSGGVSNTLTYQVIPTYGNTYGYDIYTDGKLMIHQPSIPGLPGFEGFKTEASSQKVAECVISKIKKGEMPPSITVDEMKALKAIPF